MNLFETVTILTAIFLVCFIMYYWIWGGTLTTFKWYRRLKGGIWYKYFPKMYPYMSFWTQNKDSLYEHEVIDKIEDYSKTKKL